MRNQQTCKINFKFNRIYFFLHSKKSKILLKYKVEGFHAEVYPDCLTGVQNLTVDEWLKGECKLPLRKPINTLENKWTALDENSKINKSPLKEANPNANLNLSPEKFNISNKNNEEVHKFPLNFS